MKRTTDHGHSQYRRALAAPVLVAAAVALTAMPAAAAPAKRAKQPVPAASVTLRVSPASFSLAGPRTEQQVLVSAVYPDGRDLDVTRAALFTVPKDGLSVEGGLFRPLRDGTFEVTVRYAPPAGRPASGRVEIRVEGVAAPKPVSFVNEVIPLLTAAGCSQGACHGAQYGKGGFRLSLLGFDPAFDRKNIVEEEKGKRVDLKAVEKSLLLLKPTMGVPHGGGPRFKTDSREYRLLRYWLAQGAAGPLPDERRVVRLEVEPAVKVLAPGQEQQLRATAVYSDGTTEDVTSRARFNTNNEPVATVETGGRVTGHQSGMAPMMIRYHGQAAVARMLVPYSRVAKYPALPRGNFVDGFVQKEWQRLGLLPSLQATDAEFIRRVSLDLTGSLPTPEQTRAFLEECEKERQARGGVGVWVDGGVGVEKPVPAAGSLKSPTAKALSAPVKQTPLPPQNTPTHPHTHTLIQPGQNVLALKARAKLVDDLLNRPEWVDFWTLYFGDILRNNRQLVGEKGMWSFRAWIQDCLRTGKPYNEMVRELVDVRGSIHRNGAANYYSVAKTPEDLAKTTSQVFLGVRIECAECHNHPFEKWTQNDYYHLAAYFAGVKYKGFSGSAFVGGDYLLLLGEGEVKHPRTGQVMKPKPLEGPVQDVPGEQRLKALADWLGDPKNPFVARNIVNRVWGRLMGRGIIDPVDDIRASNPPTHPELLDALTRDFVEHGFSLKHLMRTIATSYVYGLSSQATRVNEKDTQYYAYYRSRRLMAEPLMDAVAAVTGVPERFPSLPASFRAIALPDTTIAAPVLDTFGRPAREAICECERSDEPNLSQTLVLTTGEFLQRRITAKEGRLAQMLAEGKSDDEILRDLYLRALSRPPTPDELGKAKGFIQEAGSREQGLQDLLWTLLNTREFLLQH